MVNENLIRRVYGNLISNALRYGEKKELNVYINGYTQGKYAYFQNEDDGVGVPEQEISFLFYKFFTVDKSRQPNNGGSGLGLASCKSIIVHHGGEIIAFHSVYGGWEEDLAFLLSCKSLQLKLKVFYLKYVFIIL